MLPSLKSGEQGDKDIELVQAQILIALGIHLKVKAKFWKLLPTLLNDIKWKGRHTGSGV